MKKDPAAIARVGFLTENRSRAWCVPPPGYSEKRFYLSRSYSTIMSLGKFSRSAPLSKAKRSDDRMACSAKNKKTIQKRSQVVVFWRSYVQISRRL